MTNDLNDFAFGERSGRYTTKPASRHDLPPALRASIHEEAIAAFRDGKNDDANPYPNGCAAFLQWEHSYDEYKEACDAQDANDFA